MLTHINGSQYGIKVALTPIIPILNSMQSLNLQIQWTTHNSTSLVNSSKPRRQAPIYWTLKMIYSSFVTSILKNENYLPGSSKLLINPCKWAHDRGEAEVFQEGTHINVVVKCSILVCNSRKYQGGVLNSHGCALTQTSINQYSGVQTKFCSLFAEFFKISDRIHACPKVATSQHREGWNHRSHHAVVTNAEDRKLDKKYSMMPPLIYLDGFYNYQGGTPPRQTQGPHEDPINPPSVDPTS